MSIPFTATMVFSKETKGAAVFKEVDSETGRDLQFANEYYIGTLYIRKHALGGLFPKKITVQVSG